MPDDLKPIPIPEMHVSEYVFFLGYGSGIDLNGRNRLICAWIVWFATTRWFIVARNASGHGVQHSCVKRSVTQLIPPAKPCRVTEKSESGPGKMCVILPVEFIFPRPGQAHDKPIHGVVGQHFIPLPWESIICAAACSECGVWSRLEDVLFSSCLAPKHC